MRKVTIDLNRPAANKRARDALDWAWWCLSPDGPHGVHSKRLTAVFGRNGNDVGAWLRALLLERVGDYAVGKHAFGYVLREAGWDRASALLGGLTYREQRELWAPEEERAEEVTLEVLWRRRRPATGAPIVRSHLEKGLPLEFEYGERHGRLWNELQNVRADEKPLYWRGALDWDYDVVNCAPTVLCQLAEASGLRPLLLDGARGYVEAREEHLRLFMRLGGIDRKAAKQLLAALFNGAALSANYRHATFGLLRQDADAVGRLREDQTVRALVASVRAMRRHVEHAYGAPPWLTYFARERALLDAFRAELDRAGAGHFLEHDGFRCDRAMDPRELERAALAATGLQVEVRAKSNQFSEGTT
jgi:hypothetical protein